MSEEIQRKYITGKAKVLNTDDFPCAMPNQEGFDIPENAPYGEFWIMGGDSITIGSEGKYKKRVRYVHMVQLTVWVPEGKGTKAATRAGDVFKDLFANKQGRDELQQFYRFSSLQSFTPQKKNGWVAAVFRIPFTRDTIETVNPGIDL